MIAAVRDRVFGYALAGAGGGGFLILLTKQPDDCEGVKAALKDKHMFSFHTVSIDEEGLVTAIESD
jgi:fucokinase